MLQLAFPPTQAEKDVLLGVLPFYQIMGMSSGCFFFRKRETEKANFRGGVVIAICDFDWVTGRDHATA